MTKISTLGLYDSGLGGYSVFQYLRESCPSLNLILFADQKHAPYGDKSDTEIIALAHDAMSWFENQGIHHVLIACNTVSAVALAALKHDFPEMEIFGIIDLTLSQITAKNVGVVSTTATYHSKAYRNALEEKGVRVVDKALPKLVGYIEGLEDASEYLKDELKSFQDVDSLILACTHYPLITNVVKQYYNGQILDSREPIRLFVMENANLDQVGSSRVITTGDGAKMKHQIYSLFGVEEDIEEA